MSEVKGMEKVMELQAGEHLLFVFGSLMQGLSNHHFLKDSFYAGDARLLGYRCYSNGYIPHICENKEKPGMGIVVGETYVIDDATLRRVDMLEGYREGREGSFYQRKLVTLEDGRQAFAYVSEEQRTSLYFDRWPSGRKFNQRPIARRAKRS